jgi:imidazolonepropionase-like amidohydrolase
LLAVAALPVAQSGQAESAASGPRPMVIKAARLLDSTSGTLVEHGVVVVSGNKILAVGSEAQIPDDAEVIDLGDATPLPGLIDAHVHLSSEAGPNWYLDFYNRLMRFPAEQVLYGGHYAKVTLEAGITTVRDVGIAAKSGAASGRRNKCSNMR